MLNSNFSNAFQISKLFSFIPLPETEEWNGLHDSKAWRPEGEEGLIRLAWEFFSFFLPFVLFITHIRYDYSAVPWPHPEA